MSTLPQPALQELKALPPEWINTLQYAWEQGLKRKRWQTLTISLLLPNNGGLSFSCHSPVVTALDIHQAHKDVCSTLGGMGFSGAQTERFIKVAGFLVEVDVTLEVRIGCSRSR
jgi:hypothetical protein